MPHSLPETYTRNICYQTACEAHQNPVPVFWYQFFAPISGKCAIGIMLSISSRQLISFLWRLLRDAAEPVVTIENG